MRMYLRGVPWACALAGGRLSAFVWDTFVNLSLPTFLCVFRTAGERTGTGGGTDIDRREKLLYF